MNSLRFPDFRRSPRRTVRRLRLGRKTVLGIGLALALAAPAFAETLNFTQCVELALKQNPGLMASQSKISQAQAGLKQAQGSRLPKVTVSLNGMRTNDALNGFGLKLSQRNATFGDFGFGEFFSNQTNPNLMSLAPERLNYPSRSGASDIRLGLVWLEKNSPNPKSPKVALRCDSFRPNPFKASLVRMPLSDTVTLGRRLPCACFRPAWAWAICDWLAISPGFCLSASSTHCVKFSVSASAGAASASNSHIPNAVLPCLRSTRMGRLLR